MRPTRPSSIFLAKQNYRTSLRYLSSMLPSDKHNHASKEFFNGAESKTLDNYLSGFFNNVVIACFSGRAGVSPPSGIVELRDKLREKFEPLGVPRDNIFRRSWNKGEDDVPTSAPWISDLKREVEKRSSNPTYLALIGHSYGGWAACKLSRVTTRTPNFVGLIDPVFGASNKMDSGDIPRANVIKNWYQNNAIKIFEHCFGETPGNYIYCSDSKAGYSCGYSKVPGAINIHLEHLKKWDGSHHRKECEFGRNIKLLATHVEIDNNNHWLYRHIYEQIASDLYRLLSQYNSSRLAAARNEDGRLEIFSIKDDGRVFQKYQVAKNAGWSEESHFGTESNTIAVARNEDGRLEVFYTRNSELHHRFQTSKNNGWSDEHKFGVIGAVSHIAATRNEDGRLEVFYVKNGKLYHRFQTIKNSGWGDEHDFDVGGTVSHIAATRNGDGRLEVFYIKNGNIHYRYQTSKNGGWSDDKLFVSGNIAHVAATNNADGRLEVFYVKDGQIYHRYHKDSSKAWSNENAPFSSSSVTNIAVSRNEDSRLEIFYIKENGSIYNRYHKDTSSSRKWGDEYYFSHSDQYISQIEEYNIDEYSDHAFHKMLRGT